MACKTEQKHAYLPEAGTASAERALLAVMLTFIIPQRPVFQTLNRFFCDRPLIHRDTPVLSDDVHTIVFRPFMPAVKSAVMRFLVDCGRPA